MNIGISEKNRQTVATKLEVLLSDEFILYTKTRNYHWNVEGINFSEFHKLYEKQYKLLEKLIDEIAERIRTIGYYSPGTLAEFLKNSQLHEQKITDDPKEQLTNLLNDHESIIRFIRQAIPAIIDNCQDFGTADFITRVMEEHEKISWMLRSLLQQNLSKVVIPVSENKRNKEMA